MERAPRALLLIALQLNFGVSAQREKRSVGDWDAAVRHSAVVHSYRSLVRRPNLALDGVAHREHVCQRPRDRDAIVRYPGARRIANAVVAGAPVRSPAHARRAVAPLTHAPGLNSFMLHGAAR
jgi:hypothetical protein